MHQISSHVISYLAGEAQVCQEREAAIQASFQQTKQKLAEAYGEIDQLKEDKERREKLEDLVAHIQQWKAMMRQNVKVASEMQSFVEDIEGAVGAGSDKKSEHGSREKRQQESNDRILLEKALSAALNPNPHQPSKNLKSRLNEIEQASTDGLDQSIWNKTACH